MTDLKQLARDIFHETLAGVDIPRTLARKLHREGSRISIDDVTTGAGCTYSLPLTIDLAAYRSIRAVAMGKAAAAMARGLVARLARTCNSQGVLAAPHDALAEVPGFRAIGAAHPVPDEGSFAAARAILDLLAGADEHTLMFFLLTGGSSSLVELPLDPSITLQDLQQLYRLLVNCGAPIDEINAVRKHLSAVKGGRLAAAAPAAMKLSLGVTDVPRRPRIRAGFRTHAARSHHGRRRLPRHRTLRPAAASCPPRSAPSSSTRKPFPKRRRPAILHLPARIS